MKPDSKQASAVISITIEGGRCMSSTRPNKLRARHSDSIEWEIVDEANALNGGSIELRFDRDESPLSQKRPKNKHKIHESVRPQVKAGLYKYEVWHVGADGTDYMMEDPELEIGF